MIILIVILSIVGTVSLILSVGGGFLIVLQFLRRDRRVPIRIQDVPWVGILIVLGAAVVSVLCWMGLYALAS